MKTNYIDGIIYDLRWRYDFTGTKLPPACFSRMKKTTRKPLNRMTIFVASIFTLAVIVALIYLIGFTPGETNPS